MCFAIFDGFLRKVLLALQPSCKSVGRFLTLPNVSHRSTCKLFFLTEEYMSALENLKKTTNLRDFSKMLGYKEKSLAYILYSPQYKNKYSFFTIPKKNGGTRVINAPDIKLKRL